MATSGLRKTRSSAWASQASPWVSAQAVTAVASRCMATMPQPGACSGAAGWGMELSQSGIAANEWPACSPACGPARGSAPASGVKAMQRNALVGLNSMNA